MEGSDAFWRSLLNAAGTNPLSEKRLKGLSGYEHELVSVGHDERRGRLVVVSSEHSARVAALVQSDIQAAMPKLQVLTLRPILASVPRLAQAVQAVFGSPLLTQQGLNSLQGDSDLATDLVGSISKGAPYAIQNLGMQMVPQILDLIQQLASLRLEINDVQGSEDKEFTVDFSKLIDVDLASEDRSLGICALPIYDMNDTELESVAIGSADSAINFLRQHDVFQYFFPAPDEVAMGLVDRGISSIPSLSHEVDRLPSLGHPHGEMTYVDSATPVGELVESLQSQKLLVEGEYGLELSDSGRTERISLKFKPKEGPISKLVNRVTMKIDLGKLFGG